MKHNAQLGRLTVTTRLGDADNDGDYDQLYAFGGRSFSIWTTLGELAFDSRDALEQIVASNPELNANFNADHTANAPDNRSDKKGPEGVTIARVATRTYAFVGLERMSGILVVDVTHPYEPSFVQYVNNRNFAATPGTPDASDLGPEGQLFIDAANSPTGNSLPVVGNEVSGTTKIHEVNSVKQ